MSSMSLVARCPRQVWLCSSGRGSMRLSVHSSFWSRAINLEALGIHHSIHVMGPGPATTTVRNPLGLRSHLMCACE